MNPRVAVQALYFTFHTKDEAADVLYLLLGPDLYWNMVLERGWTERQLANWTERVLLYDLFGLERDGYR